MGNCFLHGNGGVSPLTFRVIGGTSQPSSPRTNDIWVNTSADIANAIFTPVKPDSTTEGRVWFELGLKSSSPLSALKGDVLVVLYPIDCQQYVSGAWVRKTAKRYTGSAWVDYVRYDTIYNAGDENKPITGGFVSKAWGTESGQLTEAPTITRGSGSISFAGATPGRWGAVYTASKVDVTNFNALYATGVFAGPTSANEDFMAMRLWSSVSGSYVGSNTVAYKASNPVSTQQTLMLDLSNISGSYYLGFNLYTGDGWSITLTKMWME